MHGKENRRRFLGESLAASAAAGLGFSLEEQTLLARQAERLQAEQEPLAANAQAAMPMGRIGKLTISRLIAGGNQVAGYAHAKDGQQGLGYVSALMLEYFTDDKILELLERAEAGGINAIVLNNLERDFRPIRVLNRYWANRGGRIQWIAQCNPDPSDVTANCQIAIDHGAVAAFAQGGYGDQWSQDERIELLGKSLRFAQQNGLAAGIGGHDIAMVTAVEKAGLAPDFYFKTLNNVGYACRPTAEETVRVMSGVNRPWIAYKVLGAGRAQPSQGFQHAFASGADFICVGMFDFQIAQDVALAKNVLAGLPRRSRAWCA